MAKKSATKASNSKQSQKSRNSQASKTKTISKAKSSPKKNSSFVKKIQLFRDQKDYFLWDKPYEKCGFATRAIHAGNTPDPLHGGVSPAIDLSTTFKQTAASEYSSAYIYTRTGNPTVNCLQRNLASLEQAQYALALSSGMAAIVTTLSLLKQGDHLIAIDDVYGGTQRYLRDIFTPSSGIDWCMIDFSNPKLLEKTIKKNTTMVWLESPTNPTLKCADIKAVADICKKHNIILVIDNTFMSPYLQNPLKLGATIVMHSITKYIGGHSDVVGGGLMLNDSALYDKLFFSMKSMGTSIAPFDAWVALRGSKTIELRVEQHVKNASIIAKWLEAHPKIQKVLYPGLPSHPHHKVAKKNAARPGLSGGSGMLSFYIKGNLAKTNKFFASLKMITLAESLGGVESLINHPAKMTHASVPQAQKNMLGITDNFCRFSIGIENADDIIADLKQALAQI